MSGLIFRAMAPFHWAGKVYETNDSIDTLGWSQAAIREFTKRCPVYVDTGGVTTETDPVAVAAIAAKIRVLPPPSGDLTGAADVAALNAVLALGGKILPNPGNGVYYLNAPLKLAAGGQTDVDFGHMRMVLTAKCNLLQNAEVTPDVVANDVTTTAASSVITSPALVAGGAAVGMMVGVPAAGKVSTADNVGAAMWLYGQITAVNGNNITLGSGGKSINGVAATTTLANTRGYLFKTIARNIKIRNGIWDAAQIWGTDYTFGAGTRWAYANDSSFMRLRRIIGLLVTGSRFTQTNFPVAGGWCYGVDPGDVTDFLFENLRGDGSSTVVNGTGPLRRGTVRSVHGQTQDDLVAFGSVGASYTDTEGDISDIVIEDLFPVGAWRAVDLYCGAGSNGAQRFAGNLKVRSVKGTTMADSVQFTNYNGASVMTGDVEDVTALAGQNNPTGGGPYLPVRVTAGQPNIVITGPVRVGDDLVAPTVLTANVVSNSDGTAKTIMTSPDFTVPPSGKVRIKINCYGVSTTAGPAAPPTIYVNRSDTGLGVVNATGGTVALNALSASFGNEAVMTGLTPGAVFHVTAVFSTSNGSTATLYAANNYPTTLRVLAA